MRPLGEDAGDDAARRRAGLLGPGDQARRRPLGMGAMRAGHVVDLSRIPATAGETEVHRHATTLEEDFDRGGRKPGVDPLVHELIRHAIEVVVDLDVIVDVGPTVFPFRQLVSGHRQGLQRRLIQLGEERTAADPQACHRAVIDRLDAGAIDHAKMLASPAFQLMG
jgi:hypothetical protein